MQPSMRCPRSGCATSIRRSTPRRSGASCGAPPPPPPPPPHAGEGEPDRYSEATMADDAASNPVGSKVLFEDDNVRVWEADVAPGDTLPIHFHDLDYVTVALTEGDVEVYEADGTVRTGHR